MDLNNVKTMKDIKCLKAQIGKNITVFLMNGFQMRGVLKDIGDDYIILQEPGTSKKHFTWKHAISTFDID